MQTKRCVIFYSSNATALQALKEQVDDFSQHLGIITCLRTPGLKERHWKEMTDLLPGSLELSPKPTLTLGMLLDMELEKYLDELNTVAETARLAATPRLGLHGAHS